MTLADIKDDIQLQRVLWAAVDYWNREEQPVDERVICYKWVLGVYKSRFRGSFHHSKLLQLEKLGFFQKADVSRDGSRRYYRIADVRRVESLLRTLKLA
jgi:hypothetical protein